MKKRRSKKKYGMGYGLGEPFQVRPIEDNAPDRPHFYIYDGLLTSKLFNSHETMLLIYLIGFAHDSETNNTNTISISTNKLRQKLGMSSAAVHKYIRSLEEKGVLVKKGPISEEDDDCDNTYEILNYVSVWDCETLDELKKETDRIKREVQCDG